MPMTTLQRLKDADCLLQEISEESNMSRRYVAGQEEGRRGGVLKGIYGQE